MDKTNGIDAKAIDCKIIDNGMKLDLSDDTIIKLFNLFLTSNPNYFYNKTYILDLLDKFKNNIDVLKNKFDVCNSLINGFKTLKYKNGYWFAVIDDYIITTSLFKNKGFSYAELCSLLQSTKIIQSELNEIKNKTSKYIICNDLYSIKKASTIRLFYNNFHMLFYNTDEQNQMRKKIQLFIDDCDEIIERMKNNERE
ncbi:hypothetical protein JYG23_12225 [Sedimentibacter sp. zth1]|uniref:hypothetical protein n=1 Tax=Sedimentibacter sp. zth1 TaxID=2816908 RepID=UPI001A913724|nr:hypothetical protein [Sedimentibacter sp. zth1]QSX05435.1 hypothetical protein JYG23_12225 [Sedimentibacter sp. zth1]